MMKLPLPWKWFLSLAVLLTALLMVINVAIGFFLPRYLKDKVREDLQRNVALTSAVIAPRLAPPVTGTGEINALAQHLAKQSGLRVTVMTPSGVVIGESDKPQEELGQIENHLQRPEVQQAIRTGYGHSTRHSATIGVDLMYVATAVRADGAGDLLGIVRVALPLHEVKDTTAHVLRIIAGASITVGLISIPLLFWMARRVTVPLVEMKEVASRVAQGDFSQRAPEASRDEIGELGAALNNMSHQLEARLRELTEEKAELKATLATMIEGVLVVDPSERIRLANDTLRRQFNLSEAAVGKTVLEAFRSAGLHDLFRDGLNSDKVNREIAFFAPEERTFDVSVACLRGRDGARLGAVAVFHDITRIKQLENIRKEFVANVSHELRTPLSIIKGYVETLLDEQAPEDGTAKQFLQTIQRHTRRLEALISDLLSIAALESQQAEIEAQPVSLSAAAAAVINELQRAANERSVTIRQQIPDTFPAVRADAQRLHQVFFNILDNAVKYVPAGGQVDVSAQVRDHETIVCIADNGPGMAPEHLPHIFERFYRVDKARSRELGGTGLGLSIVKHIIQSNGGRVWAESQLGKGSSFYFTLPRA